MEVQHEKREITYGIILVMLSAFFFGIMPFLAVKVQENGGNSLFSSLCRFSLSLPFLYILDRRSPQPEKKPTKAIVPRFFLTTLVFVFTTVFLYTSYSYIPSSLTTTIHFTYPAIVLLICRVVYKQKIVPLKYICCALCILGVVLFCSMGGEVKLVGVLLAFASAITFALYVTTLSASGLQEVFTPYRMVMLMNLVGCVLMSIICAFTDSFAFDMPFRGWLYSFLLSMCAGVCAVLLFQMGLKRCGPQNASMFSTLEPLTSVLAGVIVLKEPLTLQTGFGILLILGAVLLLSVYGKNEKA
ncbi:MAG: DMT family transporter [Clostridiales bacterium]|nr:DMT family transporter [Clostridiales bacterium]